MSNNLDIGVATPIAIRARAALPAAGAWDAAPTEFACAGAEHVILGLDYIEGAVGGSADIQLQWSPFSVDRVGEPNWYPMSAYATGVVAGGALTTSLVQAELAQFDPVGAAQEMYTIGPMELDSCVERIRLIARESGIVGNPGTLGVWASLG